MWLKADLHIHLYKEPAEKLTLGMMKPEKILKMASDRGYDVISFTCHGYSFDNTKIEKYARKYGILLIRGTETYFKGKHLLVYGITTVPREIDLSILKNFKEEGAAVVIPHPYLSKSTSLGYLIEDMDMSLFDAIELTHFSTFIFNINRKASKLAAKYDLPLISGSDTHAKFQFGSAFSWIQVEDRTEKNVLQAIKKGNVIPVTQWLSPPMLMHEILWEIGNRMKRACYKTMNK